MMPSAPATPAAVEAQCLERRRCLGDRVQDKLSPQSHHGSTGTPRRPNPQGAPAATRSNYCRGSHA